jgi:hypothetical protein
MCAFICDFCIHKKVCQSSVDGPCNEACALYTKDENFNSTQQLKAEIRTISDTITEYGEYGIAVDFSMLKRRLRELSAV